MEPAELVLQLSQHALLVQGERGVQGRRLLERPLEPDPEALRSRNDWTQRGRVIGIERLSVPGALFPPRSITCSAKNSRPSRLQVPLIFTRSPCWVFHSGPWLGLRLVHGDEAQSVGQLERVHRLHEPGVARTISRARRRACGPEGSR